MLAYVAAARLLLSRAPSRSRAERASDRGGGLVKRMSLAFEGDGRITVPLLVTGEIDGEQHYTVCVRNMFEEQRFAQRLFLCSRFSSTDSYSAPKA